MGRNVPQLRFPEFTAEWEEKTLGDIFTFYSTNSLSRDKLNYTGGPYKNIHYGDIHMIFPTVLNVSETEIPYINEGVKVKVTEDNFVVDGDIAIADASEDYADIGKAIEIVGVGDKKLVCGLHTLHGRDLNKVMVNGFKGYLLRTPKVRRQMMTLCAGAKVLGISKDNINSVVVNITSKEEQEKIKNLLVSYDNLIRNQEEKISTLQEHKQGLLKKIFTQQVRFKDQDGNDYPAWEEKKLGDICTVYDGTHQTPNYVKSGIKFVSVENIENIYNSDKYITEEAFEKEFKVYPERGDILMTRIGDIGTPALVTKDEKIAYYVSLALFKNIGNGTSAEYLLQYISSNAFKRELWLRTLHTACPMKINKGDIADCKIYCPCEQEQKKIAEVLSAFDKKIEIEQEILSNMQEFKKGLLQKMFI